MTTAKKYSEVGRICHHKTTASAGFAGVCEYDDASGRLFTGVSANLAVVRVSLQSTPAGS